MARRKQRSASAASASSELSPYFPHRLPLVAVKVMSTPRAPPAGEEDSAFVRPTPSTFPAEEEDEKRIVIFSRNCAPSQPVLQGESPFHRCVELLNWSYTVEEKTPPICTLCHQGPRHLTLAWQNCHLRPRCCSCIRQIVNGDPVENRCPNCMYI